MSRIFLSAPHLTGEEASFVQEALDSNWIAPLGPHVDAFENEISSYVGMKHAAALSSGTAAIHLALKVLGIQPGDEVICSTLTFVASANPILYEKASPVFIDSEETSWNIDPNLLEDELKEADKRGKLPKAVIVVDIYGQCANFDAITSICSRWEIPIIEDAAEALGSTYKKKKAGSLGTIGILSFNGNKIITSSGGGMLLSNNPQIVEQARFLATQARDQAPHYEHSQVGYNYRMSNICAAIGRAQLRVIDDRVRARREVFQNYVNELDQTQGVSFMPEAPRGKSNRWLTCIIIDPSLFGATSEEVRLRLLAEDIESRPVWKPMHMQPLFKNYKARNGQVAEHLFQSGLCLPSSSFLNKNQIELICNLLKSFS